MTNSEALNYQLGHLFPNTTINRQLQKKERKQESKLRKLFISTQSPISDYPTWLSTEAAKLYK